MMMSSRAAYVSLCVLLASVAICAAQSAPASRLGTFDLWAIDDMVRIDPETGKAFEENPQLHILAPAVFAVT